VKRKIIPLYDLTITRAARAQVADVLDSGWLTSGPKVAALEKALGDFLGIKNVVAVNSATSGLILALKSIGIGRGSEVITTPLTFVATIASIMHCGATPVLADIEPATLTIDPVEISRRITKRTACILPVDIAGYPCDYAAIRKLGSRHEIPIVSDSAHAFGSKYHGKSISKCADLSVYSFHATKNLTCGEGGLVTARLRNVIERVRLLSRHATSSNAYMRRKSGQWEYDVTEIGHKANMSDIQAAIGLGQLTEFRKQQALRLQLVDRYIAKLRPLSEFIQAPEHEPGLESAWHLFIVRLRLDRLRINRDRFIALMNENGVECGVHYRPVYEFSYYRKMGFTGRNLPNTRAVADRLVTLPLYAELKPEEIDFITDRVAAIVKKHCR
jgi:dTDP-4-amino-4,6-dideoxygalactose transaminase